MGEGKGGVALLPLLRNTGDEEEEGADPPNHIHLWNLSAGGQRRSQADGGLVLGSHHLRDDGP